MSLTLPVQGAAIERGRWNFYEPYLQKRGSYTDPDTGAPGDFYSDPPPQYGYDGTVTGDPGPAAGRDSRGWQCQPGRGCTWTGLV
ncbi:hypothetical protein [Streptomyces sp. NBC_01361]|uniref:hypothetical protein n=1 Tax=Streptomyces sp. NBC_01361 TaxID=2903838 RepID=UPI002E37FA5D|nr:hypothetical protein [Streptomyces sp. NBC_01361]